MHARRIRCGKYSTGLDIQVSIEAHVKPFEAGPAVGNLPRGVFAEREYTQ